jgi:hypothetical protein
MPVHVGKIPEIKLDKILYADLAEANRWLKHYREEIYAKWEAAYNLVKPDMWKHYELMGEFDLPEQILLRTRKNESIKEWANRPVILRRKARKHKAKSGASGTSLGNKSQEPKVNGGGTPKDEAIPF